jgi:LPXTG-motif cell wall-anchored protein
MLKRVLAVASLAALTIIALPTVASAHHPVLSGQATCLQQSGTYEVTWTVTADAVRGKDWSTSAPEARGPIPDYESFMFTQTYPGTDTYASISVTASWVGGSTNVTRLASIELGGDCVAEVTTTVPEVTTTEPPPVVTEPPPVVTVPDPVVEVPEPPLPPTPEAPTAPTAPTAAPQRTLPATGTRTNVAFLLGLLTLTVGVSLVMVSRRKDDEARQ